jgi:uncharacterized protein
MIARSALTLLLVLMLCACARSPIANLHSLLPPIETTTEQISADRPRIVIASTVVPASVDRPQMLVANGSHEMLLLENERWAEPLKRAIPRAIAHHLALAIPAIVWSSSAAAPHDPDLRVMLDVTRWQSSRGKEAAVEVLWTLRQGAKQTSGLSLASVPVEDDRYASLVAAHREALRRIGLEIARAAQAMLPRTPAAGVE